MSPIFLSATLLFALTCRPTSSAVPTTAPGCVQNCAATKISEGYCGLGVSALASAFVQCLRDHCDQPDIATGATFVNQICSTSNPTAPIGPAVPPPLPANGTVNSTDGAIGGQTANQPGNSTGNSTAGSSSLDGRLRALGLGALATILSSPVAAPLVSQIQQGNFTLFAPSDSALASVPTNSTNPADLIALLQYHVVPGRLDPSVFPSAGHGIVRSALTGSPYVDLPGNDTQALVFSRTNNGTLEINEPTRNVTASNFTSVGNLELSVIPMVLDVPGTIGAVAAKVSQLSAMVGLINSAAPQLFADLDKTAGLTIFAPINSVLNPTPSGAVLQATLLNHIVNGSVLYSTVLANISTAKSVGGADIQFSPNGTGFSARSGSRTLQIIQSDIITRTGVIHLVDGLFEPSNSTPTFPLVNTNNSSETVGIIPVGGRNSSTASQGASQSSAYQVSPSLSVRGVAALTSLTFVASLFWVS